MKKSFLKRAMAAAIAVPVALTQTVMLASFADGEENASNAQTINMDSLTNVQVNLETLVVEGLADKYKAAEASNPNAIAQESDWNVTVYNILDRLIDREITVSPAKLADSLTSNVWYSEMTKDLLRDPNTTASALVKGDGVELTITFDGSVTLRAAKEVTKNLSQEYKDAVANVENNAIVTGKVVMFTSTDELLSDKKLSATIDVDFDGLKDGNITDTLPDYVKMILQQAKDDVNAAVEAAGLDASVLDYSKYDRMVDDAEAAMRYGTDFDKYFYADDAEDIWEQGRDFTLGKNIINGQRIAPTLSAAKKTGAYSAAASMMADTIEQINSMNQVYNVQATLDDVMEAAETAYDIEVHITSDSFYMTADAFAYLPDELTEADKEQYIAYFNEQLADQDLEVVPESVMSIKAIDFDGIADAEGQCGEATMNIYRIVWYTETQEIETTESQTETETETDATEASDASDVTDASETDNTEASETDNTEASETDNTEASETDNTEASETDNTEASETDNTEASETDNTEASETDNTEASETDNTEASETDNTEASETDNTDATETTNPEDMGRTDVTVVTKDGFYFSHDPRAFDASMLIESATVKVTVDGEETVEQADPEKFSFRFYREESLDAEQAAEVVSPQSAYGDESINVAGAYVAAPIYVYYEDQIVSKAFATVYIGVKGDATLDGVANASDAAKVLMYAAAVGAGNDTFLYSDTNETLERFAYFLADTNGESEDKGKTTSVSDGESAVDAKDAAQILKYAAIFGANNKCDWIPEVIIAVPYPKYSYDIAVYNKLIG